MKLPNLFISSSTHPVTASVSCMFPWEMIPPLVPPFKQGALLSARVCRRGSELLEALRSVTDEARESMSGAPREPLVEVGARVLVNEGRSWLIIAKLWRLI